ncbi:hypothetical protein QE152_g39577 [Popillia japonica]|uniref:Uncharacterized protein n=1 Tax=Popillia japonica TaxID=7064 RepID=A0AAW1HTS1_POPJA
MSQLTAFNGKCMVGTERCPRVGGHTCINNIRRKWNIEQTVEKYRGTGMANKISTAAQDNALVHLLQKRLPPPIFRDLHELLEED